MARRLSGDGELSRLLERYAVLLVDLAHHDDAETLYREALGRAREHHGEPHRRVALRDPSPRAAWRRELRRAAIAGRGGAAEPAAILGTALVMARKGVPGIRGGASAPASLTIGVPLGSQEAKSTSRAETLAKARAGVLMSKIGRNEPCPCGSGKKYKKCCLTGGSAQPRAFGAIDKAFETAIEWLQERHPQALKDAVERQFLGYVDDEDWEAFLELPGDVHQLVSINAYEWALAEGWTPPHTGSIPLLDLVLGLGGPSLDVEQRRFLEKLKRSPLNLYEVLDAKKGHSLQLRELVAGDPPNAPATRWVFAPMLSRGQLAKTGTVLGLRLISGEPWRLTDATYWIPGSWTAGAVNELRANVESTPHPEDRHFAFGAPVISSWLKLLSARPPSLIDQSSGQPILMVMDDYRIHDVAALSAKLDQEPRVESGGDDSWVRTEEREDGGLVPLITLHLGEEEGILEVFGRTMALADSGRIWLEDIAGGTVTFLRRRVSDPMTLDEAASPRESGQPTAYPGPDLTPDEQLEAVHLVYRKVYANWADEPIPALGDRTPKEAVATEGGRQQVIDLLATYERNDRQLAEGQAREPLDFDFLRRQVGLAGDAATGD